MVHIRTRRSPGQQPLLAACTTSAPVRTAPVATTLRPLPLGAPARSVGILAELRTADRTPTIVDHRRYDPNRLLPRTALVRRVNPADVVLDDIDIDSVAARIAAGRAALVLPTYRPASGLPALLAEAKDVMQSRDAAFEALLTEDQARREQAAYDEWASDTDAELLAECCADIVAAVAARPELRHDHALLMALAPVVAMLKGSVA